MPEITRTARTALNCAVMMAFTVSLAANAAAPVNPPPIPPSPPKSKPYQLAVQNDVTAAYAYRTRILEGKPGCQRYAGDSDAAFLNDKINDTVKVAQLKKIGAEAAASGCLAP